MNHFFHLFSCCVPVRGYKRAVICDLQRNIVQPIPISLYEMLTEKDSQDSYEVIKEKYGLKEMQKIEEYITFLYHNQFGYTSSNSKSNVTLDIGRVVDDQAVTNAIIDFDAQSSHSLKTIAPQLTAINCKALELRFYHQVSSEKLIEELNYLSGTSIQKLDIVFEFSDAFTLNHILSLKDIFPILRKITASNSCENTVYCRNELTVIYTCDPIRDEHSCGVINEFYCIAETNLFIESVHFNSCLNKKIAVDKQGFIRNCPSMSNHYGHISMKPLFLIYNDPEFRKVWNINKDHIEVCSDCELRYVCQDCRAYISDPQNLYSKPYKCDYNPYE